jgi:hypothetical protein
VWWVRVSRVFASITIIMVSFLFIELLLPLTHVDTLVVVGKEYRPGTSYKHGPKRLVYTHSVAINGEESQGPILDDWSFYNHVQKGQTLEINATLLSRSWMTATTKETGQLFSLEHAHNNFVVLIFFGPISALMASWLLLPIFAGEYALHAVDQVIFCAPIGVFVVMYALVQHGVPVLLAIIPSVLWAAWLLFGIAYKPLGVVSKLFAFIRNR